MTRRIDTRTLSDKPTPTTEFDLGDVSTVELQDELESRGWTVSPDFDSIISGADTDTLIKELNERGYDAIDPDEDEFGGLGAYVRDRHSEQHAGTILTCTDEICDNYVRLGGAA